MTKKKLKGYIAFALFLAIIAVGTITRPTSPLTVGCGLCRGLTILPLGWGYHDGSG
jgi:hypothetical protein